MNADDNVTEYPPLWTNFSSEHLLNQRQHLLPLRWGYLSLALVPIWMLGGNVLVILAVLCRRNLRNLSNRVIASLAFTDLLLSILVVPLGIYQLVHGQWVLGFHVCLIWTGSDVILSTTSIMHLCAIALYRYHGIAHPLRQRSTRRRRHVAALIVPAWTISAALSVPFIVQGVLDQSHVLQSVGQGSPGTVQCGIFNRTFTVYSSLVSFFIPLAVMIFADFRSIQILRAHIELPADIDFRKSTTSSARIAVDFLSTNDVSSVVTQFSASSASTVTSQTPTLKDMKTMTSSSTIVINDVAVTCGRSSNDDVISGGNTTPSSAALPKVVRTSCADKGRSRSKSMVYINMLASCGAAKVNGRERRAERTLIWVFATFVVLWLPFFSTNLTFGLCGDGCPVPDEIFQAFTWLGYLSSGVNPCIYTLLNRDFRSAFKNLLMCRREKLKPGKTLNTVASGHLPPLRRQPLDK